MPGLKQLKKEFLEALEPHLEKPKMIIVFDELLKVYLEKAYKEGKKEGYKRGLQEALNSIGRNSGSSRPKADVIKFLKREKGSLALYKSKQP